MDKTKMTGGAGGVTEVRFCPRHQGICSWKTYFHLVMIISVIGSSALFHFLSLWQTSICSGFCNSKNK